MSEDRPKVNANGDAFPAQVTAAVGRWAPEMLEPQMAYAFGLPADDRSERRLQRLRDELPAYHAPGLLRAPAGQDRRYAQETAAASVRRAMQLIEARKPRHTCADAKGSQMRNQELTDQAMTEAERAQGLADLKALHGPAVIDAMMAEVEAHRADVRLAPQQLRRVERRGADGAWAQVPMAAIRRGDVFRLFEADGEPVEWNCALASGATVQADADACLAPYGGNAEDLRWTVRSSMAMGDVVGEKGGADGQ